MPDEMYIKHELLKFRYFFCLIGNISCKVKGLSANCSESGSNPSQRVRLKNLRIIEIIVNFVTLMLLGTW